MGKAVTAIILLISLILTNFNAAAQNNVSKNTGLFKNFHSINSISLLNGSTTSSVLFNTVNGFQQDRLFGGIGTGIDFYYHTSIPLFLQFRYALLRKKNSLEILTNAGLTIPLSKKNDNLEFTKGEYKTGSLLEAGLDYRIPGIRRALIFGAGFNFKQIIKMVENNVWEPSLNRTENVPIKNDYRLNRLSVKAGWVF